MTGEEGGGSGNLPNHKRPEQRRYLGVALPSSTDQGSYPLALSRAMCPAGKGHVCVTLLSLKHGIWKVSLASQKEKMPGWRTER